MGAQDARLEFAWKAGAGKTAFMAGRAGSGFRTKDSFPRVIDTGKAAQRSGDCGKFTGKARLGLAPLAGGAADGRRSLLSCSPGGVSRHFGERRNLKKLTIYSGTGNS